MLKRAFDLFWAVVGMILLGPFFLVVAVLIKLDSRGPVFYRGERVGRDGRLFRIFKFRSMVVDAEQVGDTSSADGDPRVTGIGRWIRRGKIDELPQLINVLVGEMSLVGPRPQVKDEVDGYSETERRVLLVRPGMTDWSSIRFHNEGEILARSGIVDTREAYRRVIRPGKMSLQLKYVRERTFWLDIKLILMTFARLVGVPVSVPEEPESAPETVSARGPRAEA